MTERIITRQELYDLVWSTPMASIAKDLAISDVGLAKICRRHGIPHPGRGYWARQAAGQTLKKPKLPGSVPGRSETIRFVIPDSLPSTEATPEVPAEVLEWIEREGRPENHIEVPARVSRYHPLIQKTRESLERTYSDSRGARLSRRDGLDVSVAAQ